MKTIIGTGIFNLDSIVVREYPFGPENKKFIEKTIIEEAGGTCANVMCILAHFGWETFPVAVLDTTQEGRKLLESLKQYGCNCKYVRNIEEGGTTTLKVTHKLNPDGSPKVSVRAGSPGGSRFPRRHFLRKRDEAPAFLQELDFTPDLFFFDAPAAGHRLLAQAFAAKGSLIYFEPASIKEKKDYDSIALSHIIKFSGENIEEPLFVENYKDKLFIQTLGPEGVRFNLKGQGWITLPPVVNNHLVDWEGAGDWTTSAFLNALANSDALSIDKLTSEIVTNALSTAQEIASKSVSYMGSKGMLNQSNSIHGKILSRHNCKI